MDLEVKVEEAEVKDVKMKCCCGVPIWFPNDNCENCEKGLSQEFDLPHYINYKNGDDIKESYKCKKCGMDIEVKVEEAEVEDVKIKCSCGVPIWFPNDNCEKYAKGTSKEFALPHNNYYKNGDDIKESYKCKKCGSDTDSEYESGAPEPSTKKKSRTEIVHKKCVTTYSRQDFKPSEIQSTDNESRRLNKAPKTSAERGREFRARKALLKQLSKLQQDPDAIVEIATEDIRSAGPPEDNHVPGPSEIRTIEKRAKSAEATRRWRERKKGVSESSKRQAKTAAQRMREYRERKKIAKKILLKHSKVIKIMAGSDTDSEYESGAPEPSTKKKSRTEIVHKKCVTTYSRQDFKPSETQSTNNESRRLSKAPKTPAERGREFRARKALLKQLSKQQQEPEISTEDIRSAGPSQDNQVPGPSEKRTIEKRPKSAEATRRWREKRKGVSESSKKQAKTAAQRMQEYRKRKKIKENTVEAAK